MDIIDLHAHTTGSDGTVSPPELVDLARETGLRAVAITDHDTVSGVKEALARGREIGLEVVPGVEISAEYPYTMHILGYYIDPDDPVLGPRLEELQGARRNRNPRIVGKLRELGLDVTMEEIEAESGGGQVGRPHFAQVLVNKGYVSGIQEAFDRYLAKGKPAYMDKFRFSPHEAISVIRAAGGLPVLAHPFTLGLDGTPGLEKMVSDLKEAGLVGLEVHYTEHTPAMTAEYLALARQFDLKVTGGSDFHGDNKAGVRLGRGRDNLAIPYELLAELKKLRKDAQ